MAIRTPDISIDADRQGRNKKMKQFACRSCRRLFSSVLAKQVMWLAVSVLIVANLVSGGATGGQTPGYTPTTGPDVNDSSQKPLPPVAAVKPLLPIPGAPSQTAALKRVQEVFGPEITKAKQPADKLKVARKLLDAGVVEQQDQAGRFALLTLATDIGSAAGEFGVASDAIDELAKSHAVDQLKLKVDAATAVSKVIRLPQQRKSFAVDLDPVINQCVSRDRYDLARQAAELALGQARLTDDSPAVHRATIQLQHVRECQSAFSDLKSAVATLAASPGDPDANLKIGKFRCFVKDDWDSGLPLLALGGAGPLPMLATRELSGTKTIDDQVALGDQWWAQGESVPPPVRQVIERHAVAWYQQAVDSLDKGLLREKLEQRIQLCAVPVETAATASGGAAIDWKFENLSKFDKLKIVTTWQHTKPKTTLAAQRVNGTLTLTKDASPYLVTGLILVPPGATLTIEPGAVVLFAPKTKVDNQGTLTAVSNDQWIVLANAEAGIWTWVDSSGKVELRRCLTVGAEFAYSVKDGRDGLAATECIFAGDGGTVSAGNGGHATVKDSLFFRNSTGPFGHGDDGTVEFSNCLLMFNKSACSGNFYGKSIGTNSTFYGNDIAIEGADRGDFIRVTLSNIVTTAGKPLGSRGGKAVCAGNYWSPKVPSDPNHDTTGPLGAAVADAFPKLPPCEYLSMK